MRISGDTITENTAVQKKGLQFYSTAGLTPFDNILVNVNITKLKEFRMSRYKEMINV